MSRKKASPAPESLIRESESTWIGENTTLKGEFTFSGSIRIHGKLQGEIKCLPGSELILMPSGMIEGKVDGDQVIIAGLLTGEVRAKSRILVSSTGRVLGKIHTPSLRIEFGAVLEGETSMPERPAAGATPPAG